MTHRACCRKCWEKESGQKPLVIPGLAIMNPINMPLIVCKECGNKRCPKATNCKNKCTDSNEPNQEGSVYGGL